MIRTTIGKCVECPDLSADKPLANKKLGLCLFHNKKRLMAKKPVKRGSKPRRKSTGEAAVFREIASERGQCSQISGAFIRELTPSNFMHILAKGKWPKFRLDKENIIIATREEHYAFDFGLKSELMKDPKWKWVFEKIEKLKIEYLEKH